MKIPSLFKTNKELVITKKWPLCQSNPRTLSFREESEGHKQDNVIKRVNSVFIDYVSTTLVLDQELVETPESWFTNTSTTSQTEPEQAESPRFSTAEHSVSDFGNGEALEMVVRGVVKSSERLFFEPNGDTKSILEEAKPSGFRFKESVVTAMESKDPYVDFKKSMEEMVECHGVKDWDCLEELLCWYLKVNGKKNHGFILSAFVDLVLGIASDSSSNLSSASSSSGSQKSTTFDESPVSCSSSPTTSTTTSAP